MEDVKYIKISEAEWNELKSKVDYCLSFSSKKQILPDNSCQNKEKRKKQRKEIDYILKNLKKLKFYSDNNKDDISSNITQNSYKYYCNVLNKYLDDENIYNDSKLDLKRQLLRIYYGYRLNKDEEQITDMNVLASLFSFSETKSIYNYRMELLDDLSPLFFGTNGLF